MLPSGRLSYDLSFADRLESNQRHMDYKSKDSVITAADYVLPSETIARWLLHDATVITASLLTMMLFRIVSGLWDEVTPRYVNWVVVLQGNHRKDLNRHPQKGARAQHPASSLWNEAHLSYGTCLSYGGRIRTCELWVMSPKWYRFTTPWYKQEQRSSSDSGDAFPDYNTLGVF